MKVIFITGIPFIKQHENDMYFKDISRNFHTEKWDCSYIYGRSDDVVSNLAEDRIIIKNLTELKEELLRVKSDSKEVFIITNILRANLKRIYLLIKEFDIPIFNIDKENLANMLTYKGLMNDKHDDDIKNKISSIIMNNYVFRYIYKRIISGNSKYDVVFSSYDYYPEDRRIFVKSHNVKYDEYKKAQKSKNIVGNEYILFIDAALPNHPMFLNSKRRPLDKKTYLDLLNSYFESLECIYGVEVVVSAHPKSNYKKNDFKGRKVYKYKTPELIQHCFFVISHYSTSLINAILLYKPIIFMTSEDLVTSATRKSVLMGIELARMLKANIVKLDDNPSINYNIDKTAYDDFISKYVINAERINENNSDIIVEYLKKYSLMEA